MFMKFNVIVCFLERFMKFGNFLKTLLKILGSRMFILCLLCVSSIIIVKFIGICNIRINGFSIF